MLNPDGPYPRELRQGTAQNIQLRRALPREERQRTLQCPQPKRPSGRRAGPTSLWLFLSCIRDRRKTPRKGLTSKCGCGRGLSL